MLNIPIKNFKDPIDVYVVSAEHGYAHDKPLVRKHHQSTVGRFIKFIHSREAKNWFAKHKVIWLHSIFEVSGHVVVVQWTPEFELPGGLRKGGWIVSEGFKYWSYNPKKNNEVVVS